MLLKKDYLDPISTLICLSLYSFKKPKTKISICNNKIWFQEPNFLQGPLRTLNSDGKNDIHLLYLPLIMACEIFINYNNNSKEAIKLFLTLSKSGLDKMQSYTYDNYPIICQCLSLYELILTKTLETNVEGNDLLNTIGFTENDKILLDSVIQNNRNLYNSEIVTYRKMIIPLMKDVWTERRLNIMYLLFLELKEQDKNDMQLYYLNSIENLLEIINSETMPILTLTKFSV